MTTDRTESAAERMGGGPPSAATESGYVHAEPPLSELRRVAEEWKEPLDRLLERADRAEFLLALALACCETGYWRECGFVHELTQAEAQLSTLLHQRDRAREGLKAIAEGDDYSPMRFEEDTDSDYFLRWIRAIQQRARSTLSSLEKGDE